MYLYNKIALVATRYIVQTPCICKYEPAYVTLPMQCT